MRDREADRLYRRFREQGDVSALGSLFDHTAPELLRVAAHLARDLHAAEDLVQETFVAAIRGKESFDRSRGVKPWLFGILVRQAALHHRRRARLTDDSPDARASTEAGPIRDALDREWMIELDRALETLPPLYRDVVVRHLRLEQDSQEIAQALDRAPGTVRVQIHRGLELLRRALPAGFAASCGPEADRARGLAAIRESVTTEAARAPVAVATTAGSGAGILGALSGLKVAVSFAVVIAISAVAWIAAAPNAVQLEHEPAEAPQLVDTPSLDAPDVVAAAESRTIAPAPPILESPRVRASGSTTAAGWTLRGVVACRTPAALESTQITVRPIGGPTAWPTDFAVAAQCDHEGRFECDLTPLFVLNPRSDPPSKPTELIVRADHRECAPSEVRVDVPQTQRDPPASGQDPWLFETRIVIVRAAAVSGRVVDEHGDPIGNADVALLAVTTSEPNGAPVDLVRTAADGRFRLRTGNPGACAVVAVNDTMQPAGRLVTVEIGREGEQIVLEMQHGVSIRGRIDARGLPVLSGVQLFVVRMERSAKQFRIGSRPVAWGGGASFSRSLDKTTSAADGSFEFVGLSAGLHRLSCMGGPADYVFAQQPIEVTAPAEGVTFSTTWSRVVFTVESDGAPLSPADVRIQPADADRPITNWMWVEKDGRRPVVLEGGRAYRVEARADGHRTESLEFVAPPAGGEAIQRIALVRAAAQLTLEVVAASSAKFTRATAAFSLLEEKEEIAAAGAGMRWWPSSQLTWPDFTRDEELKDGVLVLDDLPAGLFEVRIEPDTKFGTLDSPWFHEPLVVALEAGSRESRRVELVPAGRIRVEVLGADGEPRQCPYRLEDSAGERIPIHFFTRLADGSSLSHVWFLGDGGQRAPALSDPALPPGNYTLVLEPRDGARQEHSLRVEGGRITELRLTLRDE